MGMGPIPFTAIDRYAARYGIDDLDLFDDFRSVIEGLDREYLALVEARRRASANSPASSPSEPDGNSPAI
jgi:hypothetical protein